MPAEYVAEHVDLGYAVTAYRAQGSTTDTAQAVVEPGIARENLYIAMTRAERRTRRTWSRTRPDDHHSARHPGGRPDASARNILSGVLGHVGALLSAHETTTFEQESGGSIAQLAAEYNTIAVSARWPWWARLIHSLRAASRTGRGDDRVGCVRRPVRGSSTRRGAGSQR